VVVAYPEGWITRVTRADKLVLDSEAGLYRSPDGQQEVSSEVVETRTAAYLKAEATRRRKRLNRDEEKLCRDYVLLVANWRTGAWDRVLDGPAHASRTPRARGRISK